MLSYRATPVIPISDDPLSAAGITLHVKREDLNHPHVSGNKWWKLKYNLEAAKQQGHTTVLTFGGAYSNHLYATAAAAHALDLRSIGVVRGERTAPLNTTLAFAQAAGMHLHYVSREAYRQKTDEDFHKTLHGQFGDFYTIPEGGTNTLALKGTREFATTFPTEPFDYICLPVGTGGTMAGIIQGAVYGEVIGFSALKGSFLTDEVKVLLDHDAPMRPWHINDQYHMGGYAKTNDVLTTFIKNFQSKHNIPLDFVYTGKMMWGIYDLVQQGCFARGSRILAIHTGGLQGNGDMLAQ
ncbi:1-aminocyclopropane-1-carboxylate deaminase/D-cysteine desulfhydrase [Dawidia soli]|uniref:Pyridoxal-phosphate dependent enzyme n=1 Tax=Dawidia soli TaxID=2782352 RepID=A0AAP2D4N0_9BACT|nr:pyridoxal-phosphate dependent enzyme [Dawidia soli]MBT1685261.1 pyridoxal-phosphate dependent enzyme [Dawidia soli]